MAVHNLAIIGGDGIGPEVVAEGKKVLDYLADTTPDLRFNYTEFPWGSAYYRETGRMMPEDGLEQVAANEAILFGAVGDPDIPDHITLQGLLLPMRRAYDQGVCIRPSYLHPGVTSPLAGKSAGQVDLVIFRENTEGEYAPVGGRLYPGTPHETVMQTNVFTRRGTERIIRAAFEYCVHRNRRMKVTSVTKSNAQAFGMVFWDEVFDSVKADYGDVETESLLIDAAAMDFVRRPQDFDVVVASNLFGDILTDISAITVGSMGLAPSANLNPERTHPSMFEPVHGSAFELIGKREVNPIATILAAAMMVEFLGEEMAGAAIREAVSENLAEGRIRTPDIGGRSNTVEVGDDIVRRLSE
jgi:tartrate dehydrogenase/decarboxylase/D-malate dehydrogenase